MDECAEGIHGCLPEAEECRNIEGGYECDIKCRKGFAFSNRLGVCLGESENRIISKKPKIKTRTMKKVELTCFFASSDVDECTESLHPCPDPETRCLNKVGSYECRKIEKTVTNVAKVIPKEIRPMMDECTNEKGEDICSSKKENNSVDIGREISGGMREEDLRVEPEVASTDFQRFVIEDRKYSNGSGRTRNVLKDETFSSNCPRGAFYNRERKSCECLAGFSIDPVNGECRGIFESQITKEILMKKIHLLVIFLSDLARNSTKQKFSTYSKAPEACPLGYKREEIGCVDIDECLEGPGCQDNEKCENFPGGYKCSPLCLNGWRWDSRRRSCVDIDECLEARDDCPRETHRCVNANGTYNCDELKSCENGYRRIFNGSCVDIDECAEGPGCREHERCKNLPGRYDCEPLCVKGWRFDPPSKGCVDIDECLLGLHDCPQSTHQCVNTNGTYDCELIPPCTSGFRKLFNGSCVDIDECVENLHDCPLNYHRYCVNREGTYECVTRYPECPKGYEYSLRSRSCQDIDECSRGEHTCDARFNERCINFPGSYKCEGPRPNMHGKKSKPACPTGFRYDTARRECAGEIFSKMSIFQRF